MKNTLARGWCGTFYENPQQKHPDKVRYAIYGKEKCPTTGKIHWQSYIEFFKPQRMSGIKKMYNDKTVHLEIRNGTREEAKVYCQKDKDWVEVGEWIKGQGHRTDLTPIVQALIDGTPLSEVMMTNPEIYCRYRNGLKDIAAHTQRINTPAWRSVEIILHTGPTGVGKTRDAMKEATYKIQGSQLQWWDGYDGDKIICIDEYNNDVKITVLLELLDGYKKRLPIKGGHTFAQWTKVYVTMNLRMEEFHPNAKKAHKDALMRRIKDGGGKVIDDWPPIDGGFVFMDDS